MLCKNIIELNSTCIFSKSIRGRMYIVSPNYNNKSRLLSYCKIISIKHYNYVGPKAIIQRERICINKTFHTRFIFIQH